MGNVKFVWVALAGGAGAVSRYAIGLAIGVERFPWSTLVINVSGSFAFAFVITFATERMLSVPVATAVTVGFLGAYTTFSTLAWETFTFTHTGRTGTAVLYIAASLAGGLLAAWSGYELARVVR
jgi:CrcB protein